MYHSITFTNASEDDLNTGGFTETSTGLLLNGVNTWDEWHLIPSSRPTIAMPGVSEKYIEIPGRDGSIDLSDWLAGRPIYGDRQGSLEFYHQNGYEDWETVRRAMAHYFHGRTLKMILEDDPAYYYEGRFKLNEWKSEASHSKVVIDYRLKPYKWHVRPQIAESQPFDGYGLERDYDNYFYIHEFQWNTKYLRDQFVKYNSKVYICDPGNDSRGNPIPTYTSKKSFDITKWKRIFIFDEAKAYPAWSYVLHKGNVYISNDIHEENTPWNNNNWNLVFQSFFYWREIPLFNYKWSWSAGQYVNYHNRIYCFKSDWKALTPLKLVNEYWDLVIDSFKEGVQYYKGDYVEYKGEHYQFKVDYPGPESRAAQRDPWNDSYWTKIEEYVTGKAYTSGNEVIYNGSIKRFTHDYRKRKWSDDYWSQIRNYSSSESYKTGDYVMYNQEIYCFKRDYSEKDGEKWSSDWWTKVVPYYRSGVVYPKGAYTIWEGNLYQFNHRYQHGGIDPETGAPYEWSDSYWDKVKDYTSYQAYHPGQYVQYNGYYYRFKTRVEDPDAENWYGYDYWDESWWETRVAKITSISEYSSAGTYAKNSYVRWNGDIYRFNRDWVGPDYFNPDWWMKTPAIIGEIDLKGLAGLRVKASYDDQTNTNVRGALSIIYTGGTPISTSANIEGYRRMDEMNDSFRLCTINTPTHIEIRGGQL